jgi:hypothetical protein
LQAWTTLPITDAMANRYEVVKPNGIEADIYNKTISPEGATLLCKLICSELIVYKKIIGYANNLPAAEKQQSYADLDQQCGFEVDEICGTEFHYRHVKKDRQDRVCEPGKHFVTKGTNKHFPKCDEDMP